MRHHKFLSFLLLAAAVLSTRSANAQAAAIQDLLTIRPKDRVITLVDDQRRVILKGNRHPQTQAEVDLGAAPADHRMEKMILVLRPDSNQQSALDLLVEAQQNPTSPYYHHWLTPETYAACFGASVSDRNQTLAWLMSHGLEIEEISSGGRSIIFSGTVAQVEEAFHVAIHTYALNNELHFGNANDPEIPAALSSVVDGVVSLHDFQTHALHTRLTTSWQEQMLGKTRAVTPEELAATYNLAPLYNSRITGAGETIAIAGRTNIDLSDVRAFRSAFRLPANDPEILVTGSDPGQLGLAEEAEAVLDVEWSGAVAPDAAVKLVVSGSTSATDGVFLAAQYIVEHNLAPVMTVNFGACEAALGSSANHFVNYLWQQAAAQGISVVVPTGNEGSTACGNPLPRGKRAVNGLASTPYNTSISADNDWEVVSSATDAKLSGGASTLYDKPWWQYGEGASADVLRNVPDVTLGVTSQDAYPIYLHGRVELTAGSSVASASFAGMMALVVQHMGVRQGNAAPTLYALANRQQHYGGALVFHKPGDAGDPAFTGYNAIIGLGSVNAYLTVTRWNEAVNGAEAMAFNKNGWVRLAKQTVLPLAFLLASPPAGSQNQPSVSGPVPVLFYSDIESGPATGGEGGADGAFVCVYGENFGASRGTSAITLGGVQVAAYKLWTDPGAPYRPGYYAKACGQINHMTPPGAAKLQLTTSQGSSNALSFTIRPGKVYFVAASGNDKTGDGSSKHPWGTIKRCKIAMNPGDTCYVNDGVFSSIENYGAALVLNSSGTPGNPKAIIAYPGATVKIDNHTTGSGRAALVSYLPTGTYAAGQSISDWTIAGLSINGSGMAVALLPGNNIRMIDNEIMCQGPYCYGADGGLLVGHPAAVSSNFAVLGNRIHDVGCHEDADYAHSVSPCQWAASGTARITTKGATWATSVGLQAGEVIRVNGQMRRIQTVATSPCCSGTLDSAFNTDITSMPFQLRSPSPTKLFHSVYFGNTNSVQFGWNDVDGSKGQACRGVQFHSTNGHNEYDLHVFSNAIHDTVCDCLNFATVDPSQGTVEAFNNVLYNCGTANPTITNSGYSAIYSSNTNDNYAETMTRKGNIQAYNNTIYNAGSGSGAAIYATNPSRACFAVQVSGGITSTFPHARLAAAISAGNSVSVPTTGLCGYGTTCTSSQQPVPFRAGQLAVLDTGANMEEVQITSVPDAGHVVLTSVSRSHSAGVTLNAANGNVGITASNNVCAQPGVSHTAYAALIGRDEVGRTATAYLSGGNNDCYGLTGSCPSQLTGSLNSLPAFAAPTLSNFRLPSATPLLAAGTTSKTPTTDQDGNARPTKPTIGAFEAALPSNRQ